jgi:hypothetical protein
MATGAEHVECGITLFGEVAPVCNGEGLVKASNACKELTFQVQIMHLVGFVGRPVVYTGGESVEIE